ncbi:MAG: hypothetical protein M1140_16415 [Chloroflexi bacterium]|nr:hypothetical protein [Chloroflexota bacterium]
MIKFIIGFVFGVILGAIAILFFGALGRGAHPLTTPTTPAPRQSAIRISVNQSYLNQEFGAALADQPQLRNMHPQLAMRAPNAVVVSVDLQASVAGVTLTAHPAVTIQLYVAGGRIRTRVADVNVGAVDVPLQPFQAQIDQAIRMMEDQANRLVNSGLAGTGLKVVGVSTTSDSLVIDLGQ